MNSGLGRIFLSMSNLNCLARYFYTPYAFDILLFGLGLLSALIGLVIMFSKIRNAR